MEDYGQKYNEAMARLELVVRTGLKFDPAYIFPELNESEDVRIIKDIITTIQRSYFLAGNRGQMIAWLEKQKNHFREGPEMEPNDPDAVMNRPLYLEGFDVGKQVGEVLKSQKPTHISGRIQPNFCEEELITEAEEYTSKVNCGPYGVVVTEAYIAGALKERDKKHTEWSEGDEKIKIALIKYMDELAEFGRMIRPNISAKMVSNWIKSIHPQPYWKPSEEQIEALTAILTCSDAPYVGKLHSLLDDLKALTK